MSNVFTSAWKLGPTWNLRMPRTDGRLGELDERATVCSSQKPPPPEESDEHSVSWEGLFVYALGLQPYPQKVVRPPKPTPTTFEEVVGALGIPSFLFGCLDSFSKTRQWMVGCLRLAADTSQSHWSSHLGSAERRRRRLENMFTMTQ